MLKTLLFVCFATFGATLASKTPLQRNVARHHKLAATHQRVERHSSRSRRPPAVQNRGAAPAASTCAPVYTNKVTIKGPGNIPVPTTFITRKGNQFLQNGKAFAGHGANIYWLAVDENVGAPGPTDHGRIREVLAAAVAMGATTVRAQSLGISVGSSYSIWPAANAPNEANFRQADYAIAAARAYGLRLIIPLCDDYSYYVGGKYTFLGWTGASQANNGAAFYTDRNTINLYKQYITAILTRRNVYTGVRNADEPAIMAWETGNEWGAYGLKEQSPPFAWTNETSTLIKQLAPRQLVIDGTDGVFYPSNGAAVPGTTVGPVDVMSDHQYPPSSGTLAKDASIASKAGKALIIGEYDWKASGLGSWLNSAAQAKTPTLFWSLFARDASCCSFVQHSDGYTLSYPPQYGPNTASEKANIQTLVSFMWKANWGKSVNYLPAVACPQPYVVDGSG